MAVSIAPALRWALVTTLAAALPSVQVRYGYGVTGDPSADVLMVGATDPLAEPSADQVASSQQGWAHANHTARDETGDISCVAMSWNGNAGQEALRAACEAAYGIAAGVEATLRADPAVGALAGLLWVEYGTDMTQRELQDADGSLAYVAFSIHYRARI